MRLLLDSCLSWLIASELRLDGHDVGSVAEWDRDPGDAQIMAIAAAESRVIITNDKGFGALAVLRRMRHAGMIRFKRTPPEEHLPLCRKAIALHEKELLAGAIVVVSPQRIRVRMPGREKP
jgi:predicted nuclease of predicted toxin-antitoxin system